MVSAQQRHHYTHTLTHTHTHTRTHARTHAHTYTHNVKGFANGQRRTAPILHLKTEKAREREREQTHTCTERESETAGQRESESVCVHFSQPFTCLARHPCLYSFEGAPHQSGCKDTRQESEFGECCVGTRGAAGGVKRGQHCIFPGVHTHTHTQEERERRSIL
jgi:hypothetical protein